jgi:hypothetical protein
MTEEPTQFERLKKLLLNNKFVAALVLASVIVIGIGAFTDSLKKLGQSLGILHRTGPRLIIVDVVDEEANYVEFKLKNSGDDSAFLKSVEFILGRGSIGCDTCSPQIAFVYRVKATLNYETVVIEPKYRDKDTGEFLSLPSFPELQGPNTSYEEAKRVYDEIIRKWTEFRERVELVIGHPSEPLRISQSVPPKGVDSFRIVFVVDGIRADQYYIFPAHAVIRYDAEGAIKTKEFHITIRR